MKKKMFFIGLSLIMLFTFIGCDSPFVGSDSIFWDVFTM